jgi:hypothetical protein
MNGSAQCPRRGRALGRGERRRGGGVRRAEVEARNERPVLEATRDVERRVADLIGDERQMEARRKVAGRPPLACDARTRRDCVQEDGQVIGKRAR